MQNLCSENRKNVCLKEYMFEIWVDKRKYVRYNELKHMFAPSVCINLKYFFNLDIICP